MAEVIKQKSLNKAIRSAYEKKATGEFLLLNYAPPNDSYDYMFINSPLFQKILAVSQKIEYADMGDSLYHILCDTNAAHSAKELFSLLCEVSLSSGQVVGILDFRKTPSDLTDQFVFIERLQASEEVIVHPYNTCRFAEIAITSMSVRDLSRSPEEFRSDYINRGAIAWENCQYFKSGFYLIESFFDSAHRVYWVRSILAKLSNTIKVSSSCIDKCLSVAQDRRRWSEGHALFSEIRSEIINRELADNKDLLYSLLLFTEVVAKIIFNESMCINTFDRDSGWNIGIALRKCIDQIEDASVSRRIINLYLNAGIL